MERTVVADWDNTMRKGFTMGDWTRFLAQRGSFPSALARSIEDDMEDYGRKAISYEELAHLAASKYASGLSGEPQDTVSKAANDFVETDQQLFEFVQPFIDHLQQHCMSLVLVSGCPYEPLLAYQQLLGFSRIYALTLEVANGVYTNKLHLDPTLANEKARIVKDLAHGSEIVLALGDSEADLPLLEAAPHTIIIDNPGLAPQGHRMVHRVSTRSGPRISDDMRDIVHKAIQGLPS